MADAKVNWYTEKVTAQFVGASLKVLSELAFIGEGKAKINITDNDQVDTGFMRASTYAVTPGKSSYTGNVAEAGLHAYEGNALRSAAPAVALPDDHTCAVAVAAEYAIYQEMQKPFLFPVIESLAKEHKGAVERNKIT
jgi:hypothetical protein